MCVCVFSLLPLSSKSTKAGRQHGAGHVKIYRCVYLSGICSFEMKGSLLCVLCQSLSYLWEFIGCFSGSVIMDLVASVA